MAWFRWIAVIALLFTSLAPAQAQKRIALSFDDVPRGHGPFLTPDQRTEALIAALKRARVKQAAFFVNPGRLANPDGASGEARIAAYVRAGHVIANHSFSHKSLTDLTAEAYLADIDSAEDWLRGRPGRRPWFRYPFLNEGRADKAKRDAVRAGLDARGLRNGHVTADGYDWYLEGLTIEAIRAGRPVDLAALRMLYIETMVGAADFFDGLAVKATGRSPVHMLLLHETDLAALFVEDLVAALRADGWAIATADQAYADPIGRERPDVPSAQGTLTELVAWERGLPRPRWYERNDETVLKALFDARVLRPTPAAH
ncbi:polysaccharide deacetylase family protein [Sphingomonas sp.]|uniref:polysaccharide deacetylase family protein n=1 Tax=Sphingomonas sp. TaxID=28214 RepID=UPI001B2AE924|nr:polysaccharide deacetylase family protein [Sphingomonas sp.]MBO9714644.1 polysaccharide deacetylase family protein [Sphingomonas sp.]